MNYLAHFVLSGNDPQLLLGNFIGDAIKGQQFNQYPERVAKGILLHRYIDDFTDNHPVFRLGTARLRDGFNKFSPVILDVFYDHFLAVHWNTFMNVERGEFINSCYNSLLSQKESIPEINRFIIDKMADENWLGSYHKIEGIHAILERMSKRTSYTNNMATAYLDLEKNYELYSNEFLTFFPEIQKAVSVKIEALLTSGSL